MTAGVNHPTGVRRPSLLTLEGQVTWEWLVTCRDCGQAHDYVFSPQRGFMTWATPECDMYRPRVSRWLVDALMVEHRAQVDQERL